MTLVASGSEVALANDANRVEGEGIATAVVSMPCLDRFDDGGAYQQRGAAGVALSWSKPASASAGTACWAVMALNGMSGFGESAPAGDLFNFGITETQSRGGARQLAG